MTVFLKPRRNSIFKAVSYSLSAAILGFAAQTASAQITFNDVFENPENAQLNLDYAKQEAAAGNLLQAASTLERLLYAEPNWDSARLFYTYVLLQLDDRQAASRELVLLESRPLNGAQKAELARMNTVVTGAPDDSGAFAARIKAGVRYDDNGANTLTDVVNRTGGEDDLSLIARAAFTARTPLIAGLDILGGGGVYLREPSESASRSYRNFHGNIGIGGGETVEWTARIGGRAAALDGDDYLTELGPRGDVSIALSDETKLTLGAAGVYQDYKALPGLPNERFRSGQKYSVTTGLSHKLSPQTRIGGFLTYDDKHAKTDIFAYDAFRITANIFHTPSTDRYVSGNLSYRALDYDGINTFATPPTARDDDHIYARAAYGVRLSAIAESFESLDNVFIEGAVDWIDRSSNISAFDYDNVGAELSLNWDF